MHPNYAYIFGPGTSNYKERLFLNSWHSTDYEQRRR